MAKGKRDAAKIPALAIDAIVTMPSTAARIGRHNCFGMNLAKMEMRVMLDEVLSRMDNPQFDGDIVYMKSNFIQGIKQMPITFAKRT